MSGFVSSPAPAASTPGLMIACGPFWPDIDVNHFRDARRIGGTLIPDARVVDALAAAVLIVAADLDDWSIARQAEGHDALEDVPGASVGGESGLIVLWRRAVYAYAAADLRETHGAISATATGQSRADEMDMSAEDHRRNGLHAIRAIRGTRRTAVELI